MQVVPRPVVVPLTDVDIDFNESAYEDRPREALQPALRTFTLPELEAHTFEHRAVILERNGTPVLREGHLAEMYGARGLGKTWLRQTLALVAATGGDALGFRSPEPMNVLDIDGEMDSEELQHRYVDLRQKLGFAAPPNLKVLAADWQDTYLPRLDTVSGQVSVEPLVEWANLIFIDNRSTLFDPEAEKDPVAWQPAQDWLLSLRRRRKAVMLVHHANRQGGARGHTKPEDVMNLLLKLSRPESYTADQGARFLVEFEKARGAHGAAVAPFTASLTSCGWELDGRTDADHASTKLREYLRLAHAADDRPTSANSAIVKAQVGRNAGLKAWAELKRDGLLKQHPSGGFYVD
jgi:hypothetical protein